MASYDCSADIQNLINHGMTIAQIEQEAEAANVRRLYIDMNNDGSIHIGENQNRASEAAWNAWYGRKITTLETEAAKNETPTQAKAEPLATTRQVAFITKLASEGRQVAGQSTEWDDVTKLTKREASTYIDRLLKSPKATGINYSARAHAIGASYGVNGGIWDDM